MKKLFLVCLICAAALLIPLLGAGGQWVAAAEGQRGISLSSSYTSVVIESGKDISLDVVVANEGEKSEEIELSISGPGDWDVEFQDWSGKMGIRRVYILPEESTSIRLQIGSTAEVAAGDYAFVLKAATRDGLVESTLELLIRVEERAISGGAKLESDYPVLPGPSGSSFEFKVDLTNETDEDLLFNLLAGVPQGWEVFLRPAYEQKQIASIGLQAGEKKGLEVELSAPERAAPGEYPVMFEASAGDIRADIELKVIITGSYELSMGTSTGLLNTRVTAGEGKHVSLLMANTGSAELKDITFISSKPEGWVVGFDPDKVDSLPAGGVKEVAVEIEPSSKAIAGDYEVGLTATAFGASDRIELRVTVATSPLWGWVGVIIVVVVIAALAIIFTRLGRR